MKVNAKFIPQLIVYDDKEAREIIRNLKKIEIKNEYQLVDTGIKEYISLVKLDGKAFRYAVKDGEMFLRESVHSVGGLVVDTVLLPLGEFTQGIDDANPDLSHIARIKDARAKQREKQLRENERIALWAINQINKTVKNTDLMNSWKSAIEEAKRFVKLGSEDYYQSQMDILSNLECKDETAAKIIVEYNTKIQEKNEKWVNEPLKLSKPKSSKDRVSDKPREDIGKIDPKRRQEFEKYYSERSLQVLPYLTSEEEVAAKLPAQPQIIYENNKEDQVAEEVREVEKKRTIRKASIEHLKKKFDITKDNEISR